MSGSSTHGGAFGVKFSAPLLLGTALNPINSSLIATALVTIGNEFHKGPGDVAVLVSALYLCSAVMQPAMGKFGIVFGSRRIFMLGLTVVLIGSLIGATACDFWLLVLSRALIGIGTSAAYPTAMALVRQRADATGVGVPGRIFANFSIAGQVIQVVGLPLGGVLTEFFGWRAIFLVNVPVAILALTLSAWSIAASKPVRREAPLALALDLPGMTLFAGAITSSMLFLGDISSPNWLLLLAATMFIPGLIAWETRASHPLIDVKMLSGNVPLLLTYARQILVSLGLYIAMFGIPQWMESAAGYSSAQVGLILLPLSAVSIGAARAMSTRGLIRSPLLVSAGTLIVAGILLALITSRTATWILVAITAAFGISNGANSFANQATLYIRCDPDQIAVGAGLYRTFNYLGAVFSASLLSFTMGSHASDSGVHLSALSLAIIGAALLTCVLLDHKLPRRT